MNRKLIWMALNCCAVLVLILVDAVTAGPSLAQIEFTVRVVQVQTRHYPLLSAYVEVLDESGLPVTDLRETNFVLSEEGQSVEIVDFAGVNDSRPVDIVFVFDTTGSMEDEVEGVKNTCVRFAQTLEQGARSYRLGLVTYWDDVRQVRGSSGDLTDDVEEFRSWVEQIAVVPGSGDGTPENAFGALKRANQMNFRSDAQRVFILITDARPHYYGDSPDGNVQFNDPDLDPDRILDLLGEQSVSVYAVAFDTPDYRRLAAETGGQFYPIASQPNFTDIIQEIGANIATQYRIDFHSPRPSYDGTRREIQVLVGDSSNITSLATGEYLERHLLNIKSDLSMGVECLIPLLALLALPVTIQAIRKRFSFASQSPDSHPSPGTSNCPGCGAAQRPGATYCSACGTILRTEAAEPSEFDTCPCCGKTLRPGARFCNRCGRQLSGGEP